MVKFNLFIPLLHILKAQGASKRPYALEGAVGTKRIKEKE